MSSKTFSSWRIAYDKLGEPLEVLNEQNVKLDALKKNEVLVNFRASPINPSDLMVIKGLYPLKHTFPDIGGNEGAGYVLECGPGVTKLKPGDLVIPVEFGLGTWCNLGICDESKLIRLNPKLSVELASVIDVNPCTAYLLLRKFVDLKPGDCVIQNGATSTAAIYLMQMCKLMGVNSINLFRARDTPEKTEATRKALMEYGATLAVTEEELKGMKDLSKYGPICIGYDCLGGEPALTILDHLKPSGTFVNYGGMLGKPIPVHVKYLIFKDIHMRGFWLSGRENAPGNMKKRMEMLNEISTWMIEGKIKPAPAEMVPYTEWKSAISRSTFRDGTPNYLPSKYILSFPEAS